ncbi:hypothetical protein ACSFXN_06130 [Planococcus sp. 1R117A]|uniref:hypothetical protein n=1 Tax=Planococcus sp. 1R117A TaxID=3447020 RepID=UPI003EDB9493
MKLKMQLYISMVSDAFIVIASVALVGYMLYLSAFTWYVAGPIMFTAGDRAAELVKNIRKIKDK